MAVMEGESAVQAIFGPQIEAAKRTGTELSAELIASIYRLYLGPYASLVGEILKKAKLQCSNNPAFLIFCHNKLLIAVGSNIFEGRIIFLWQRFGVVLPQLSELIIGEHFHNGGEVFIYGRPDLLHCVHNPGSL
jgi:hypothetical protein